MTVEHATREMAYGHWPADAGEAAAVTPQQIVRFVKARRWVVASVVALSLIGGLAFDLLSSPRYLATSQIIIDPRGLQVVDKDVNPRGENADADVAAVEDEMRVIKSTNLLSELIDKEDLTHNPEFAPLAWPILDFLPHRAPKRDNAKLSILQELDQRIAVRRTERSFVIDISVVTGDPEESARLANRLVELYIAHASKVRAELAQRSSKGLHSRLEELQAQVRQADEKVEAFRAENNLVNAGGVLASDQRLRDLNAQLTIARTREDDARAKLEQIEKLQSSNAIDTIAEAIGSQTIIHLRDQLAAVRQKQGNVLDQLGPRHPDSVALNNELRTLERLMAQELRRFAQSARNDYARAKDSERAIERSVAGLSKLSLSDSRALVTLHELERDADASRALFTSFLARSRELSEQTGLDMTNVRQISDAMPPLRRSNPSHALVLAIAVLIGLVLGLAAAIVLGFLDRSPRRREALATWR